MPPIRKPTKIENKTPNKYTTPLKSLLNIDDKVKKHINIKGASLRNRNENVPKFKSILY